MATRNDSTRRNRLPLFAGVGLLALVAAGFGVWWFMIRDTSPASVSSVAAEEARSQAVADAVAADDDVAPEQAGSADEATNDAGAAAEAEGAQADAPSDLATTTDGVWTIDSSIGTFDRSCLTDVCGSSFVGFRIDEELVGFGAKTVVGRTNAVTGSIELSGSQVVSGSFTVDMSTLITDNEDRTNQLRVAGGGLETGQFPEAAFVLTEPIDLGSVPAEGVAVQVEAVGDLTVHGVTKRVTIPLTAELQAGVVIVFGNLDNMLLADYGIPIPSAAVVLSVEDHAIMELQFFFSR